MLASRSYQHSQPTHCGSRFAESSLAECEKGWLFLHTVRNPAKCTPVRESRRGWPETWVGASVQQDQAQHGVSQWSLQKSPRGPLLPACLGGGASVPCRNGDGALPHPVSSAGCRGQGHRFQIHLPWFKHLLCHQQAVVPLPSYNCLCLSFLIHEVGYCQ